MAFRLFLDANILLDFTFKRAEYESARNIIGWAVEGRVEVFITPAIVQMVGYWLTKVYKSAMAKDLLLTLLADVRVIDIGHETIINALSSRMVDFEDALQYYTALHHRLDYFISRDKSLKKTSIPVLPVYSPEEFLKLNQ